MRTSLLIVDDHRVFSQGLEEVFAGEPDFDPVAVTNPDQALALASVRRHDAVLMDVRLGKVSGIDLTRRLTALSPPPVVIVLTGYADATTAAEAIRAGAVGFVPKSASVEQVVSAVRSAVLGGTWLPAGLLRELLADGRSGVDERQQLIGQLTAREHQVLSLMVSGLDRDRIAEQLHQSPNTVRTHIRNVTVKLGCHSALEVVAVGLRAGLRPQ